MKGTIWVDSEEKVDIYDNEMFNIFSELIKSFTEKFAQFGLKIVPDKKYFNFTPDILSIKPKTDYYECIFVYNILELEKTIEEAEEKKMLMDQFISLSIKNKNKYRIYNEAGLLKEKKQITDLLNQMIVDIEQKGFSGCLKTFDENNQLYVKHSNRKVMYFKIIIYASGFFGIMGIILRIIRIIFKWY